MSSRVHIFWDNSNIFIPAKYVATRKDGGFAEHTVRIHFANLFKLAKAGREVARAVAVGSVPPGHDAVWNTFKKSGVEGLELYDRGKISGKEQAVDQSLQVHMLRAMADAEIPQVAVLLTGDGAGYEVGVGFHADLERMAKRGWGIEVLAWGGSCAKGLREFAEANGVFVDLEDHYSSVTFLQDTRSSIHLNLRKRRTASPRKL